MKLHRSLSFIAASLLITLPAHRLAADDARLTLTPARFWAGGLAAAPRFPLVGDADGDGRADILAVYPPGDGIIDLARTSAAGKPRFPLQARTHFGKDIQIAAIGRFRGGPGSDVLAVSADWSVHVASSLNSGNGTYSQEWTGEPIPSERRLKKPPFLAACISTPTGTGHVLLADADGRLLLLRNKQADGGEFGIEAIPLSLRLPRVRQMAVGTTGKSNAPTLFWADADGKVFQAGLPLSKDAAAEATCESKLVGKLVPGERIATGHFRGQPETDLILGQRLLPGGDPNAAMLVNTLPNAADAKGDVAWFAGDIDGDGKDDLVRVRRSGERFVGDDFLVQFSRMTDETEDRFTSTSGDGLLDAWKRGTIKPGGVDLAALGCRVGKFDILVEVQRIEDVPDDLLHREMERVVRYFANLPVTNPDGTKGIALHVIYREPIPLADARKPWWELGDKYHPTAHRGLTHWMVVYNAGGGQSGEMTDRGSCGSRALYATFLHEFGHQLGLDHTGHWAPAWCPVYPSLMNYAYSYQLNGKPDEIGYSDGRLAGVVLNENNLSETLPLPPDKLKFLSGPPYHYRMKPTPDGKGTLIDWNWNGIYGEKSVATDINYGYSTTGGLRHTIGKTYTAPVLVSHGEGKNARLLLFAGLLPPGAPVPPSDAATDKRSLAPDFPGRLVVRLWNGMDAQADAEKWGEEIPVEASGVIGDASAVHLSGTTWIAYPTAAGITVRPVTLARSKGRDETPVVGEPTLLPDTAGCSPTLATIGGRVAVLLWRDETTPVNLCLLDTKGAKCEVEKPSPLPFTSRTPVGAVEGAADAEGRPSLWVGLTHNQDEKKTYRCQVRRLVLEDDGQVFQTDREWIGGDAGAQRYQSRPVLLWQPDPALQSQGGQLWYLGCGLFGANSPWACHYVCTRIADRSLNGGWLTRRYYDEWTQSRSAPGACFFRGEMVFAARWYGNVRGTENDNLFVAFQGRGIESQPMGDFDDIGYIRDLGMSHSIAYQGE